ncbi:hypothetical protein OWR29_25590 [Actinoplanes sp. Pm04-4]|uniref:Minor tail protein n=1 Tax=Paractinoplanes pyxinae TaxID=2997416 RepID=A0ABT4B4G6_9ACTN|nr:hypothetical protein [Actinoplanes pyxinae]MCY1141386.1 hypothetical protein [Actinoplanes pyxinae]
MASSTRVRMQLGGQWVDVTGDTKTDDPITIKRGRRSHADQVESGDARLTLRDDGRFNWRNPLGPYYGQIGPNTPVRIEKVSDGYAKFTGQAGDNVSTPDHASLDVTGDVDVRLDADMEYGVPSGLALAGKYVTSGNQRSWLFMMLSTGQPAIRWSANGTTFLDATSTAALPQPARRTRLRFTLDVNNGASGWTVTFYTAPSMAGPWTQLGAPVTGSGVTSVYSSTAPLVLGEATGITLGRTRRKIHAFQMRNGINGTVIANLDLAAVLPGTATVTDSAGRVWTPAGAARFDTGDIRFCGLLQKMPNRWNTSGLQRWTEVMASGLIASLEGIDAPVRSPIYREATAATNKARMVGYWPGEDGSEARTLASGIGRSAMKIRGSISLATNTAILGSQPLPELSQGTVLEGYIPRYTVAATPSIAMRATVVIPPAGFTNNARLLEVHQTTAGYDIRRWVLRYTTGGGLALGGYDTNDLLALDSGPLGFNINGAVGMIGFNITKSGTSNVYYQIFFRKINGDLSVTEVGADGTWIGYAVGRATRAFVAPGGGMPDAAVGHIMVGKDPNTADGLTTALVGNAKERSGRRVERLARELGITLRTIGNLDETTLAGPQRAGRPMQLLRDAADIDQGILFETRDELALTFRTLGSLYKQRAGLTLTYDEGGESPHLDPDPDALDVVNDVTVSNLGGSSARAVLEEGPLSVLPPGQGGVGRKEQEYQVNVYSDAQLPDQASWRLHMGTWDEERYPRISVRLHKLARFGKTVLVDAAARLDIGDRLVLTDLPSWMPPGDIDQLVEGYSETLGVKTRPIDFDCSPAKPFDVGTWDDDPTSLWDSSSARLSEDIDPNETLWNVVAGRKHDQWDPAAVPFWIVVGGEPVLVTAVTAPATSPVPDGWPQTLTVTRGSWAKAHADLTPFQLLTSGRWGL